MNVPLKLRRVDARAHAHARAVQRWRQAGRVTGLGKVCQVSGHLRFRARTDDGHWHGLIKGRDWLRYSLPRLQSLLAIECPLSSIAGLFRTVPQPLPMKLDELHYRELVDVELVEVAHLPADDLPWIDTSVGRIWITGLPRPRENTNPVPSHSWLNDLPLRLVLTLGSSKLEVARLVRLQAGDVLRIMQLTRQCWLADRCVGHFTFTQEGLYMQSTEADAVPAPEHGAVMDLGSLPATLEFVLASHDIDLGTLSGYVDGQLIPLAADAALRIEVRANGKRVARGELVQLDEGLGVELLEVYRTLGDE